MELPSRVLFVIVVYVIHICKLCNLINVWNYIPYFSILMHDSNGLAYNEKVRQKCEDLYNAGCRVNHLLACIIDICQEKPITDESPDSIFHINNALKVLSFLLV